MNMVVLNHRNIIFIDAISVNQNWSQKTSFTPWCLVAVQVMNSAWSMLLDGTSSFSQRWFLSFTYHAHQTPVWELYRRKSRGDATLTVHNRDSFKMCKISCLTVNWALAIDLGGTTSQAYYSAHIRDILAALWYSGRKWRSAVKEQSLVLN